MKASSATYLKQRLEQLVERHKTSIRGSFGWYKPEIKTLRWKDHVHSSCDEQGACSAHFGVAGLPFISDSQILSKLKKAITDDANLRGTEFLDQKKMDAFTAWIDKYQEHYQKVFEQRVEKMENETQKTLDVIILGDDKEGLKILEAFAKKEF